MKIFELRWTSQGEKEWVSGRTNIEALKTYLNTTGTDINDLDELDEIVEIPKERWGNYTVENETEVITFVQWMQENKKPDVIAGTWY